MQTKRALTADQERHRSEGLRTLARIIARRALAHQEHDATRSPVGRPEVPPGAAHNARSSLGEAAPHEAWTNQRSPGQ